MSADRVPVVLVVVVDVAGRQNMPPLNGASPLHFLFPGGALVREYNLIATEHRVQDE